MHRLLAALFAVFALLSPGRPAAATTYVMVSDADLVRQAAVIVVARVLDAEPARSDSGLPATAYRVVVEESLQGEAAVGELLVVKVPGGMGEDGVGYRVWGAPRFAPEERAILFLGAGPDGTYRPLHLMLGVFHELAVDGRRIALRDLSEAGELRREADGAWALDEQPTDLPRDFDAFIAWLAAGARDEPDYFLPEETLAAARALASRYVLLSPADGVPIRWFEFDRGVAVPWQADGRGQPGLSGGGLGEIRSGLGIWTDDPGSGVRYTWGGTTSSTETSCAPPSRSGKVVFDDPHGDIEGSYRCGAGGVLAHGGPCYQFNTVSHEGQAFHPAVDGFITTNDGLSCFFQQSASPSRAAEEIFTHELGHTLGLGHTPVADALMYAYVHDDGRGGRLHPDDRAGIAALYGTGSGPPPPPPPGGPAAPSQLQATALSPSQARLTWRDNSNDETSFRLERRSGGSFQEIASLPAGSSEHQVDGLAAGTRYEFRVRAHNGEGFSAYSNTAAVTTPAGPAAPGDLTARVLSATEVRLTWRDRASDETDFRVEMAGFGDFHEVAVLPAGTTSHTLTGLEPAALYHFRVRARNGAGFSAYSAVASATTPGMPGPCVPDGETLCLLDGVIRVQVAWRNQHAGGRQGVGRSVPGTRESGSFWFFSRDNLELVVKALDGSGVNGYYWFFYGALSDVEYWVRVTRSDTGEAVVYRNPPGEICGRGDIRALRAAGQAAGGGWTPAPRAVSSPATRAGACVPDGETLCLLDGRFAVRVDWLNQRNGSSGVGGATPWADRTGFFWFFAPDKLELVVKALDGSGVNGYYWFFYGALSDVQYRITVTDTASGASRVYDNPAGEICGQGDTTAF